MKDEEKKRIEKACISLDDRLNWVKPSTRELIQNEKIKSATAEHEIMLKRMEEKDKLIRTIQLANEMYATTEKTNLETIATQKKRIEGLEQGLKRCKPEIEYLVNCYPLTETKLLLEQIDSLLTTDK